MPRFIVVAGLLSAMLSGLSGCGLFSPNHAGGIATRVSPEDYGRRLCRHVNLEDYSACVSQVLDYFDKPRPDVPETGHSTSGPFAAILNGEVYLGHYHSNPFQAAFYVTHAKNNCRGSYNAMAGSRDATFDVYCSDGRKGWADIVLDQGGRNGIGHIELDDGTKGDIVFGYVALGQEKTYPYVN